MHDVPTLHICTYGRVTWCLRQCVYAPVVMHAGYIHQQKSIKKRITRQRLAQRGIERERAAEGACAVGREGEAYGVSVFVSEIEAEHRSSKIPEFQDLACAC